MPRRALAVLTNRSIEVPLVNFRGSDDSYFMMRFWLITFLSVAGSVALPGCGDSVARLSTEEAIERGNVCLRQGDYTQSVQLFTAALEKQPENVTALNNRAVALIAQRQFELAYDDATRAIRLGQGRRADSYLIRGTLHHLLQQHDQALADANRSLEINDRDPKAYRLRAQIHQSRNQTAAANRDLQQADYWAAQPAQ